MVYRVQSWKQTAKRNKYGAKKTEYKGIWYHSKFEAGYAIELDYRIKAGEKITWERQKKIDLKVNGRHICNYYIDFVVHYKDGENQYVEVKGFETMLWRLKWKLFEALIQEIDPNGTLLVVK